MAELNERVVPQEPESRQDDVILSILRLSRALRRCPPEKRKEPYPPAVDRLLFCVENNSGVSSRELCELLDLRPSSLSELLARGEAEGLLIRITDENDRRIQHVSLSEKGRETVNRMEAEHAEEYRKKTSCFSEAEARQFCELSRRLTSHLESLAKGRPFRDDWSGCYGSRPFKDPETGISPPHEPHRVPEVPEPVQTEEQENHKVFPEGARFRS